jgi:UDP-glucose 4-epimerase
MRLAILFVAHGYVGEPSENPSKYYRHISVSIEFLDSLLEAGMRRLVFSSSCSIYETPPVIPVTEGQPDETAESVCRIESVLENTLRWYDRA